MNVLLLGNGAREHALAWKLRQSNLVDRLYIYPPGNPGIEEIACPLIPEEARELSLDELADYVLRNHISLMVPGPEQLYADGIVDFFSQARFAERGVKVFGPTKEAARIETSKIYAKQLADEAGIPTAKWEPFDDDLKGALQFAKSLGYTVVIKVDGLAKGKGAYVCSSIEECKAALDKILVQERHGLQKLFLVEERLRGREVSLHAITDGYAFLSFPPSQDHKPLFDGDRGPNTGGMGVRMPVDELIDRRYADETFIKPLLHVMQMKGIPFKGLLYPGLMMTDKEEGFLLEVNCRFGNPEAAAYIPMIESDLADLLLASIDGTLARKELIWKPGYSCAVVLASPGYPSNPQKRVPVSVSKFPGTVVFYAGVKQEKDELVTAGGRVLEVVGIGDTREAAANNAYNEIGEGKNWVSGALLRRDIG